jgi:PmbA protein
MSELMELAHKVVKMAVGAGATEADCYAIEQEEFNVDVRLGKVENLKQATSKGLGLRVIVDKRVSLNYTSDLSAKALSSFARDAVTMGRYLEKDELVSLPDAGLYPKEIPDLALYDSSIAELPAEKKIELARRCEEAALSYDKRIVNSEGGSCSTNLVTLYLVNSAGFSASYRKSSISIYVSPVAEEKGKKQVDYWFSSVRGLSALEKPEVVGRIAGERVVRRLNPRKIATIEVPVVFDPLMAADFISAIFSAISGDSVYRRASFLADQLGKEIASPLITVIDDPLIPRGLGSKPFDGEGVTTYKKKVIDKGVLATFLHNTYTAKKLSAKTTGNATRGLTSPPGVGYTNFYLSAGEDDPKDMIKSVKEGLYLTRMFGFGANPVTGDFSRGASGVWIENGELAYPVEEITVAGHMKDMLKEVEAVGNDLKLIYDIASPTVKFARLMVAASG